MTISFENENDVVVYALEKLISYARNNNYIFLAQTVWWISSIIGLQEGLVTHIDNLRERESKNRPRKNPKEEPPRGIQINISEGSISPIPRDIQEDQRQDRVIKECEEYLKDSRRLRDIAALKATGKTLTGFINPTAISKKRLKKKNQGEKKQVEIGNQRLAGIDEKEITRRRKAKECLRCAWPANRKGSHWEAKCRKPIKLDPGSASFLRKNTLNQVDSHHRARKESIVPSSSEESFNDSV
jgi:hypothetical protein